jgi:hypothetical protein
VAQRLDLTQELSNLLAAQAPKRLLALGGPAHSLLAPLAERTGAALVGAEIGSAPDAVAAPSYDLALVTELDQLSPAEAGVLLGRLRDLYARRIWVLLRKQQPGLGHRDLIGYGFSGVGGYTLAGEPVQLYEFDIGSYKTTPDWLNNKHWANPRLFDKHRW